MLYNTKERELEKKVERDVRIKLFGKVIYFRNAYHLLSLGNDILLGLLYFGGSIATVLGLPSMVGNILYLIGGFFFVMRPIINLTQNVHAYDYEEIKEYEDDESREDSDRPFDYKQASREETEKVYNDNNEYDDYKHY